MLIFDEVMTGFRVGLHGAQGLYGITPDLTTLGKVIGGGMPVGAFGGRRDIMQCIAPLGPVYQAGTLSGNPVAVAAGLATLKLVQAPGFLRSAWQCRCTAGAGPAEGRHGCRIWRFRRNRSAGCSACTSAPCRRRVTPQVMECDKNAFNRFFHAMLAQGVYLAPSAFEAGFVSAAHGDAEIDATIAAASAAFAKVAAA